MLKLVALHTLATQSTSQGLERNPALKRKGGREVGSICSSLFIYKYQVRIWKFINKWIPQNSITSNANLLISTSLLDLGWNNLHSVGILKPLSNLRLWWRRNHSKMHHRCKQGRKSSKGHNMATHAMACTDRSTCIKNTT
jgi:hypothetical protein